MICKACNANIPDNSKFCSDCGEKVIREQKCLHCNIILSSTAKFCHECGTKVSEKKEETSPQPAPKPQQTEDQTTQSFLRSEFQKYIPQHVVEQILQKGSMEEEMKNVAVIFADISGFTSMSENLDPEEVTNIMNSCFQRLVEMVHKYEGTVNKFIGDCVMAIFGAPVAHEDDCERAVRCALGMMREIYSINKESGLEIGMSIGINAGKVFAGLVGSSQRKEYTVMGDTVNLAQRLESAAKRGQILVGSNVYKLTSAKFEYRELEPLAVKGKKEKVTCFEVISESKYVEIEDELALKLIGREREIIECRKILEKVKIGDGQIIYIHGEAGIGKSRLARDLSKLIKAEIPDINIFKSACVSHTVESYRLFGDIIKKLSAIENSDNDNIKKEKLLKLTNFGIDKSDVHFLAQIFSLHYEDSNIQFFDESKKKLAIFMAIRKLINKISATPLLVVFDNLQWIDSLSQELIELISEDIANRKILLCLCSRGLPNDKFKSLNSFNLLTLNPLDKKATLNYAYTILNTEKLPDTLSDLIFLRSSGNPLFIEEIIKALRESNNLERLESGEIRYTVTEESSEIPSTLVQIIASRIDRLPADAKRLMQHLSVIGREFRLNLVKEIMGETDELKKGIDELLRREMIFKTKSETDLGFIFKSLLFMEVSYGSILKKKLKEIHELVASAIENLNKDHLEENFETLAFHYFRSNNSIKALFYLERAGDKLSAIFQLPDARLFFEQGIEICEDVIKKELIDKQTSATKLLTLYLKMSDVAERQGDIALVESTLSKLLLLAEENDEKYYIIKALMGIGRAKFLGGEYDMALDFLGKALLASEKDNLKKLSALVMGQMGDVYERMGNTTKSLEYLRSALAFAEEISDRQLYSEIGIKTGTSYLFSGKYTEALEYYNKTLKYAEENKDKFILLRTLGNMGIVYIFQKDFDKSLYHYKKALEIAREISDKLGITRNLHNMAELHYEMGNYEEALKCFDESLPVSNEIGWKEGYANNMIYVGYLAAILGKGDKKDGIAQLNNGIEMCRKYNFSRAIPMGLSFLAKIYAKDNEKEKAKEIFNKALKVAEEQNFKKMVDDIKEDLSKL